MINREAVRCAGATGLSSVAREELQLPAGVGSGGLAQWQFGNRKNTTGGEGSSLMTVMGRAGGSLLASAQRVGAHENARFFWSLGDRSSRFLFLPLSGRRWLSFPGSCLVVSISDFFVDGSHLVVFSFGIFSPKSFLVRSITVSFSLSGPIHVFYSVPNSGNANSNRHI